MTDESLSHVDSSGKLRMVDVSAKEPTRRTAAARCVVATSLPLSQFGAGALGLDLVQAARLTGIQSAKLTAAFIPLCHPLGLDDIQVDVVAHVRGAEVRSRVSTVARTGVEMEALTACAFGALALVDSLLTRDVTAHVVDLAVATKTGGKSDWGRDIATLA